MSGITVRKRTAKFDAGYVERNRLFLWGYPRILSSPRLRKLMYRLPLSRMRMTFLGRFFRQLFQAWTEGDLDSTLSIVHPEIELKLFGLGSYRGAEGMRQAWEEWHRSFRGTDIEVSEVIDNRTGRTASVTRIRGRAIDTGMNFTQPGVMVWTHNGVEGIAARIYPTKEEALEAAGLSE